MFFERSLYANEAGVEKIKEETKGPYQVTVLQNQINKKANLVQQLITVEEVPSGIKGERLVQQQPPGFVWLEVKPRDPKAPVPEALERTFLALNSPQVHLQPGSLVRISGWVRIPKPIIASADGALLYDSIGGEPLAVRLTDPCVWKQFTLYREVPESGTFYVTLALTGIGRVDFDDVRVEPLLANGPLAQTAKQE